MVKVIVTKGKNLGPYRRANGTKKDLFYWGVKIKPPGGKNTAVGGVKAFTKTDALKKGKALATKFQKRCGHKGTSSYHRGEISCDRCGKVILRDRRNTTGRR